MKKSSFVLGWDRNENRSRGSYSRARFWRLQLMGWSTQWPQKSDRRPQETWYSIYTVLRADMAAWDDGLAEVCHSVTESVEWQVVVPVVATVRRLKFVLASASLTRQTELQCRCVPWHYGGMRPPPCRSRCCCCLLQPCEYSPTPIYTSTTPAKLASSHLGSMAY